MANPWSEEEEKESQFVPHRNHTAFQIKGQSANDLLAKHGCLL
jgi:hypothetical protein